jgi:hypothetical protein
MNPNIVQTLSAETLLAGAPILNQIEQIRDSLNYKAEDGVISVSDYFNRLRNDIGNLKSFELNSFIAPGTEYAYMLSVTNSLQDVLDQLEQVTVKAVFFQSRLKSIQKNIENAGATFSAWYQIALASALKTNEIKLPISAVKSLGDSEFCRLMDGQDLDIEAMILSVEVHLGMLKSHKNLAQEKYKMAKDQINASISNIAPSNDFGNESLRLPRYQKLQDKYGDHFKQPPVPEEEIEDDEPVVYKKPAWNDEEEDESLLTEKLVDNTFKAQMADPDQDVVFEEEETEHTPAVEFEPRTKESMVKTSVQAVSPVVVDDPFLGRVKVEDDKVVILDGVRKGQTVVTEEDDDEPILFKKKKISKPVEEIVKVVKPEVSEEDDDEFPAINQAQAQFNLGKIDAPAKNIKPKPKFEDDDLEDIM